MLATIFGPFFYEMLQNSRLFLLLVANNSKAYPSFWSNSLYQWIFHVLHKPNTIWTKQCKELPGSPSCPYLFRSVIIFWFYDILFPCFFLLHELKSMISAFLRCFWNEITRPTSTRWTCEIHKKRTDYTLRSYLHFSFVLSWKLKPAF